MNDIDSTLNELNRDLASHYRSGDSAAAVEVGRRAERLVAEDGGDSSLAYASILNNLGVVLLSSGKHHDAERAHRQALEIRTRLLDDGHEAIATSLANLGSVYEAEEQYEEAERLFDRALALRRALSNEDDPDCAGVLEHLASIYRARSRFVDASAAGRKALEIRRRALGPKAAETFASLNNLALTAHHAGNYGEAETLYLEALALARDVDGATDTDAAITLSNLAEVYKAMGKYDDALRMHEEVLAIRIDLCGGQDRSIAETLENIAHVRRYMGDDMLAKGLYERSVAIRGELTGEEDLDYATAIDRLARVHAKLGEYREAFRLSRRAMEIRIKVGGEKHRDLIASMQTLGGLYIDTGSYSEAKQLYLNALDRLRTTSGDADTAVADVKALLAHAYLEADELPLAEQVYTEAISTLRAALGDRHPTVAAHISSLGVVKKLLRKYDEAAQLYEQVMDIKRATTGEANTAFAITLANVAELHSVRGEWDAACREYDRALRIMKDAGAESLPLFATIVESLAGAQAAAGRYREAAVELDRANAIDDVRLYGLLAVGSERRRLVFLQALKRSHEMYLSLVGRHLLESPVSIEKAFELTLGRKGIVAETMGAQRRSAAAAADDGVGRMRRELTALTSEMGKLALTTSPTGHRDVLEEMEARKERLEEAIASRLADFGPPIRIARDVQPVLDALPAGSTLIEFVSAASVNYSARVAQGEDRWLPARYFAFVLPADRSQRLRLVDVGDAGEIDSLIAGYRDLLLGGRTAGTEAQDVVDAERPAIGVRLRELVFDRPQEAGGWAKDVIICPDGGLCLLPFDVLPLDAGKYVIDEYRIGYRNTARDLIRPRVRRTTHGAPLVAADPHFDLCDNLWQRLRSRLRLKSATRAGPPQRSTRQSRELRGGSLLFRRLKGARREGKDIGKTLAVRPLLGGDVREASIRLAESPLVLHLATHGFFLDNQRAPAPAGKAVGSSGAEEPTLGAGIENPLLRSGLALAGANSWLLGKQLPDDAGDGVLNGEDISTMDLTGTELVVLSACETALGDVRVGEGVFGLRRAFVMAGARTLVMSLWKVPDQETRTLMVNFYGRLKRGESREHALHESKCDLKAMYANPLVWGAFICEGDPGPIYQVASGVEVPRWEGK